MAPSLIYIDEIEKVRCAPTRMCLDNQVSLTAFAALPLAALQPSWYLITLMQEFSPSQYMHTAEMCRMSKKSAERTRVEL